MGRRQVSKAEAGAIPPLPDALPRIGATSAYKTKFEIIQGFRSAVAAQFSELEHQGRLENAAETEDILAAILEYRINS